mmetsp:Transcript_9158/g.20825  ORF Transcript_9158/g.20825 Transcript_9158/m.20825 type:complete len:283 (+) Transcript_9158:1582-2430(+)
MASVRSHRDPRPASMPRYGGRPVSDLKTGTNRRHPTPKKKMIFPLGASSTSSFGLSSSNIGPSGLSGSTRHPTLRSHTPCASSANSPMIHMGTARLTTDGRKMSRIVANVERFPLIHSMVVVTSPMGVHAPPALAAMTTAAPKYLRLSGSGMSLRSSDTMTMVDVRLSRMALMKKVMVPMKYSSSLLVLALMDFVMRLNPWCASTISTMVIAPMRKKSTSDVSPSFSCSSGSTSPGPLCSTRIVHSATAMTSPTPLLLKASSSSSMIPIYPMMKTMVSDSSW